MNEQLEESLADIINKAVQGADAAKDFLVAETPEVIQQLVAWHGVYNFILFCFSCLYGAAVITAWVKIALKYWKGDNVEADKYFFTLIGSVIALMVMIPSFATMNVAWLQIWIAPKVWLIEYAAKLLSS